jgi:hypothetical protein
MSGIIIYIPQVIPTPPINPTSTLMPVKSGSTFVDSNIKNVVDDVIETQNALHDAIGLKLDFINNIYEIGDPLGLNINLDTINAILNINGATLSNTEIVSEKLLSVTINGVNYYIQLYTDVP